MACADVTPEGGLTYPSVKHLSTITCQDDKTIYKGLAELVTRGYLKDTGKRTGHTGQIIVYELVGLGKTPENGSVQRHPFLPSKTPVPPVQRHPKTGHGTPKEELQEERLTYSELFEKFWSVYPKGVGKSAAYKAWKKKKLESLADRLIEDVVSRVLQDDAWKDIKFVPHASTYLNQERWTDEVQKYEAPKRNLSAVERVELATRQRAADRQAAREDGRTLETYDSDLRPQMVERIR